MSLIFGADGLADVRPPCVLQSFVNHGAVLHKVFVVGDQHFCVERPSLKNFPSGPCGQSSYALDVYRPFLLLFLYFLLFTFLSFCLLLFKLVFYLPPPFCCFLSFSSPRFPSM